MATNQIEAELVKLVRDQWEATGKVTLLSFAGAKLSKLGLWPPPAPKQSLLDFIRGNLSNQLRVERWPQHPLVLGLFPIDARLEGDIGEYFSRRESQAQAPRYRPAFWAAFAKPISQGHQRFLDLDRGTFEELPQSSTPTGAKVIEISPADIPPTDSENRDELVLEHIKDWAIRNNIDPSKFYLPQRRVRGDIGSTRPRGKAPSLMDKLFDALSDRDLVRIQMPLDIVAKLRRFRD